MHKDNNCLFNQFWTFMWGLISEKREFLQTDRKSCLPCWFFTLDQKLMKQCLQPAILWLKSTSSIEIWTKWTVIILPKKPSFVEWYEFSHSTGPLGRLHLTNTYGFWKICKGPQPNLHIRQLITSKNHFHKYHQSSVIHQGHIMIS